MFVYLGLGHFQLNFKKVCCSSFYKMWLVDKTLVLMTPSRPIRSKINNSAIFVRVRFPVLVKKYLEILIGYHCINTSSDWLFWLPRKQDVNQLYRPCVPSQVGAMLKPFLPQLQTTFIKALNDPNREVRVRAASALQKLIKLHTRVDPLFTELHNGVKNTEDNTIRFVGPPAYLNDKLFFN